MPTAYSLNEERRPTMLDNGLHLAVEDTGLLVHRLHVRAARVAVLTPLYWVAEPLLVALHRSQVTPVDEVHQEVVLIGVVLSRGRLK